MIALRHRSSAPGGVGSISPARAAAEMARDQRVRETSQSRRRGVSTVNHCMHGPPPSSGGAGLAAVRLPTISTLLRCRCAQGDRVLRLHRGHAQGHDAYRDPAGEAEAGITRVSRSCRRGISKRPSPRKSRTLPCGEYRWERRRAPPAVEEADVPGAGGHFRSRAGYRCGRERYAHRRSRVLPPPIWMKCNCCSPAEGSQASGRGSSISAVALAET